MQNLDNTYTLYKGSVYSVTFIKCFFISLILIYIFTQNNSDIYFQ